VTVCITKHSLSADSSFSKGIQQPSGMLTLETKQILKQPGLVLAIIMVGAQATVYHLMLIDNYFVAMRQFHAGSSPSE
jgi:hypothetical protein